MDYSIAIVWLALAFANFGKWHLVRCEVFSNSELSSIDETIAQLMSCRQIPGLGMAIAKNDQFLAKGYGVADVKEETPMTENTVMCIGSATKAFTSALLAVLITEDNKNGGTLSWKTSLQEIFGEEFRLTSDPIISSQVTIEDILSHRSGVGSADAMLMAQLYSEQHRKALLSRLHLLPKKGEFRGQFSYNNLMYGLAGLVAEAIGKKPYFELMKEKLLEPLNISSAVLVDNMDYSQNLTSKPHQMVNGSVGLSDPKFFRLGAFSPAGALCLSPADLTKWLYFLNHYGTTLSQKRLISSLVFANIISSKVALDFIAQINLGLFKTFPEPSYTSWYTLGWFGRFYRGDIDFFHGGSMFSFHSTVVMDPTSQTGIALTVNGLNPTALPYDLYPLAYFLKDILLGQSPWLNATTICSYPEPWNPSSPRTPPKQDFQKKYVGSTEEFVGKFGHALYGEVLITENDQSLNFQWGNIITGTLYDRKKSKFFLRLDDNVFQVLGSEFGSAIIAFSDYSSGQYNKIGMTLFSLMETYDFTRGVLFEASLPLTSTSSSAVTIRTPGTQHCSLSHRSFLFTLILSLVLTW